MSYRREHSGFESNAGPTISLSQRISFQQFDEEVWRIYFTFVKALLTVLTSILYFAMLVMFFLAQQSAFAAAQFMEWVSQWNPEKPAVFQPRPMAAEESYEDAHAHRVEAVSFHR